MFKTLTQPPLWVPHISLVFGEMWEVNCFPAWTFEGPNHVVERMEIADGNAP